MKIGMRAATMRRRRARIVLSRWMNDIKQGPNTRFSSKALSTLHSSDRLLTQ